MTLGAVVVGVEQRDTAVALGTRGVTVVVAGQNAADVGEAVRAVTATGARAAAFVGDPSDPTDADALVALLAELFGDR